jgi:plasmid stabilization system protein ParE
MGKKFRRNANSFLTGCRIEMGAKKTTTEKNFKVKISLNAIKNIDEITGYIAFINHQPLNAIRVGDKFFETFRHIEKNPYAFKECNEISTKTKKYRQAVCQSWLIIYKIKDSEITILGIIHTSRKPSKIKTLRNIKD